MAETATFSVSIDKDIKSQSESIFNELGLNLATAINVFLRKSIQEGGFPFEVKMNTPNAATLKAMQEIEAMEDHPECYKSYDTASQMMRDILK